MFDKSTVGFDNMLLCASCKLSEYSQIYQVNIDRNELYDLSLPVSYIIIICFKTVTSYTV